MKVRCSAYMEIAVARSDSYLSFARKAAKVLQVVPKAAGTELKLFELNGALILDQSNEVSIAFF